MAGPIGVGQPRRSRLSEGHRKWGILADVDVLVIGTIDPDELHDRVEQAEAALGREVNFRRIRPRTWEAGTDPFVATVKSRLLVKLHLSEAEGADEMAAGKSRDRRHLRPDR